MILTFNLSSTRHGSFTVVMYPKVLTDQDKSMWKKSCLFDVCRSCWNVQVKGDRVSKYRVKQFGLHEGNIDNNTGIPLPSEIQQTI